MFGVGISKSEVEKRFSIQLEREICRIYSNTIILKNCN